MKFMQRAEAARKARNDEDVERMRQELVGDESQDEDERENGTVVGRRKFGPTPTGSRVKPTLSIRNEFEEFEDSHVEITIRVLEDGAVPLTFLKEKIERWSTGK